MTNLISAAIFFAMLVAGVRSFVSHGSKWVGSVRTTSRRMADGATPSRINTSIELDKEKVLIDDGLPI
jgi:hypothetical protein